MEFDRKAARVCWAYRHGGYSWACAEYRRSYGAEPIEHNVRMICRDMWAHLEPGAFSAEDAQTQTSDGERALMQRFGYTNPHAFLSRWHEKPMEWQERMNGVDRAALFDPDEVIPAD